MHQLKEFFSYEPDSDLFTECKSNLADYPFVDVRNFGVWDKREKLHFNSALELSKIDESGEIVIDAISLDENLENERITFIKMDIEGAELKALNGAKNIIKSNRPTLVICIYHNPEDIIELAKFVLDLKLEYNIYIRQQAPLYCEGFLFAVPKER